MTRPARKIRSAVAEKKAVLALALAPFVRTAPPRVNAGSVQLAHAFLADRKRVLAVARSKRSSVRELEEVLDFMRRTYG